MRSKISHGLVLLCLGLIAASGAEAGKPTDSNGDYLGNGYPSGPHFNLNIHSKDASTFVCPGIEYDEDGNPLYGNVINIPDDGRGVEILMESGSKGPKNAPATATLEVTDPCTGFDNRTDPATFRLPANAEGYAVYIKLTGKPTDEPSFWIENWGLKYVQDECGNDLLLLGLVTTDGFAQMPVAGEPMEFIRTKGKSKAVPITDLFMWQGSVCYFEDPGGSDSTWTECCSMADVDGDGVLDVYNACGLWETDPDPVTGEPVCLHFEVPVYCSDYTEDTWVFNIADFVGYFWNVSTDGVKNVKLRFYPLPLQP
jgi:hypothetical protein